jgi:hypothetical protein
LKAAARSLDAFARMVRKQAGKRIPADVAALLVAGAQDVLGVF